MAKYQNLGGRERDESTEQAYGKASFLGKPFWAEKSFKYL